MVRTNEATKASTVVAGDMILGYSFKTQSNVFRRVLFTSSTEISAWRIVKNHKVSPAEPIWDGTRWTPAYRVPGNTFDGTPGNRIDIKVEVDDFDEANYWLLDENGEPDLLIHNSFVLPC